MKWAFFIIKPVIIIPGYTPSETFTNHFKEIYKITALPLIILSVGSLSCIIFVVFIKNKVEI